MSYVMSIAGLPDWIGFALNVSIKVSILLAVAGLMTVVLWKNSAAVRHRVWSLAFCGALLVPLLSMVVPRWEIPVLPENPVVRQVEAISAESNIEVASKPDFGSHDASTLREHHLSTTTQTEFKAPQSSRANVTSHRPFHPDELSVIESESRTGSERLASEESFTFETLFLVIWISGFILSGLPLLGGVIQKRLILSKAREIHDSSDAALLRQLCGKLDVNRTVRRYELDDDVVPMTWGIFRPVILLPVSCADWSQQRRRIVLLHELAHVKRLDYPIQLLARLVCGLYWFNPLAWYGLSRLRIEREMACDDCVVNAGERASDYASELISVAETHRDARLVDAVAMARTTKLEARIHCMFDRTKSHRPLTRRSALGLTLATSLLVLMTVISHPVQGDVQKNAATRQPRTEAFVEASKAKAKKTTDSLGDPLPQGALLRLGTMRFRHPSTVSEMALSPDGTTVVTASPGKLIVWDAITGKEKWRADEDKAGRFLPAAAYGIRAVAFTPDSQKFYASGPQSEVILWDVATGRDAVLPIKPSNPQMLGMQNRFRSIDVTPDGKTLALGSGDGVVISDTNGKKLYEITNKPDGILKIGKSRDRLRFGGHYSTGRFSPDGKVLAIVTSDTPKVIRLHDPKTGEELRRIRLKSRMVRMTFSPDGQQIVATERDQAVRLYDVVSGKEAWSHIVELTNIYIRRRVQSQRQDCRSMRDRSSDLLLKRGNR